MWMKFINAKMVLWVPQFYFKTDYPDQSNQKQNWHTRFKTEQKQSIPEKIATEGDVFVWKGDIYLYESKILFLMNYFNPA